MRKRTKSARWFVLAFYLIGIELLAYGWLMPVKSVWLAGAPLVAWGIALLIIAWDIR